MKPKDYKNREYRQTQYEKARKPKIQRCSECKIYFDSTGNYPTFFSFYGAPEGLCVKHRKED